MTRNRFGLRASRLQLEHLEDRSVPSTFTVNTTLDDLTPANGKLSLREAITKANDNAGADVIVLPVGVFRITQTGAGEDANTTGDFDITSAVTIQGAGAGLTIINGQQLDRVFDVFGSGPSSIKVIFQGATVRNGVVTGPGGGISVVNADLVVRDCAITDNRASGPGGGISNNDLPGTGNVKLLRSTVARNLTGATGGGGTVIGGSTLTVADSTVRRNSAALGGGGIDASTARLTNSTVSGNSAGGSGGGIDASTATLTNSIVSGNTAATDGGGIFLFGTATLTDCTVSGNSVGTGDGGGIQADTATLTGCTVSGNSAASGSGGGIITNSAHLTHCTLSGNSAAISGGGMLAPTATLSNCTISGNFAAASNGGLGGGGIFAFTAILTNCTVSNNSASTGGGGGIFAQTTATLTNCAVSSNSATSGGGGISGSTATLTNCTVSSNTVSSNGVTSGSGGGINAMTATLTNCTVSGNSATLVGGGMLATTATLTNCTIVENLAHNGGGLFHAPGGAFNIKNTIVALNLTDFSGSGPDVFAAFTSQGHNLIGNGTGSTGFTNGVNGDIVGTSNVPIDPKLGLLQNNGGKTQTMALKAGSLAIDAGDNTGALAADQRGLARKKDGNFDGIAIVDIGAFER
jgi:CSLREA domain-containing protein